MGIKDLLRFMKPYVEPIHIKKYAGKRVGIDAYSWLHKGAYSCSMEICLDSNSHKKSRYLAYFMHRINLLRYYEITPVVVFDGGNIPCKAATEHERHRRREANREMAMAKLEEGNVNAAQELFQRAVSITPVMAYQLIQVLKSENIEFVVAPYEADAQLAYLSCLEEETGGIEAVITEDSDLIAYGCQVTIFKMDRYGSGEEIVLDKIFNSTACMPSFGKFDQELFIGMCVLAGCDFLPSVPGIGIARAYSLVSKYRNLDRVLSVLKFEKGDQMPKDYSKSFKEAVAVFQHARIYDADSKKLKHMTPLPQKLLQSLDGELDFLGPEIPPSVATAVAEGKLDPISMEAFDNFPTSGYHFDALHSPASNTLLSRKGAVNARQQGCFSVFSSRKTRERHITGAVVTEGPVSIKMKHLNEAAGLEKLVLPQEIPGAAEKTENPDGISLKVPNNNPFKRRKVDEMKLDQLEIITEEIAIFTGEKKLDILCPTENIQSKNGLPKKHKENEINLDERENVTAEISVVTEVQHSETLGEGNESPESVSSKHKTISIHKGRNKNEKLKGTNCKSSAIRKTSILDFFSNV